VIERALKLFDKVIVAVRAQRSEAAIFTLEERLDLLRKTTDQFDHNPDRAVEGLLVEFAISKRRMRSFAVCAPFLISNSSFKWR